MMNRTTLVTIVMFMMVCSGFSHAALIDDFESGNLDGWTIGGRQLGTHTANVVSCGTGTSCGHLYQSNSFTEINMYQDFSFNLDDTYNFDLYVDVNSTQPPAYNYYGMSGVSFGFLDAANNSLGSVWYLASTTNYPSINWVNSTRSVNVISENVWHKFELDASSLLSQISIDETQVASTRMLFQTYSSTWPSPRVSAELYVDNINTSSVPVPGSILLMFSGLLGMCAFRSRIPKSHHGTLKI